MCDALLGRPTPTVNSRGDVLTKSLADRMILDSGGETTQISNTRRVAVGGDPSKRAEMLLNWLTAGGAPKQVDPSEIFAKAQAMAPVTAKAGAGMGIGGLFGMGTLIGDLTPKPIESLKPLNKSPMQPGVPYSVPPLIKPPGGR